MIEAKFLFAQKSGVSKLLEEFNKSAFLIKGSRDMLSSSDPAMPHEFYAVTLSRLLEEQQALPAKIQALEVAVAPYLTFKALVE